MKRNNLPEGYPPQYPYPYPYPQQPIKPLPVVNEDKQRESFWKKVFSKKQTAKLLPIIYLRKNGIAEPLYVKIENGQFKIGDKVYHEREDCRYKLLMGKESLPFAVVPEDNIIPVGTSDYYAKLDENIQKVVQEHQEMAIKAIRHAEIVRMGEDGKKPDFKLIIIIAIIAIIALALLKDYI
jgi:hypothetical protein